MQSDAAGEPEGGVVEDGEVDPAGKPDVSRCRCIRTPPRRDVEVGVGPGGAVGSATEHEGESGAGGSERLGDDLGVGSVHAGMVPVDPGRPPDAQRGPEGPRGGDDGI